MSSDVVKRLSFDDPTQQLLRDMSGQRYESANLEALSELRTALEDLSTECQQKFQIILEHAQHTSKGGGANDLKRLQRQFQALKASYVNIDVKERFMSGLDDAELGVKHHEALSQQNERQLELDSEKLRDLKAQSDQARHKTQDIIQQICQLYQQVNDNTYETRRQLDSTQSALAQYEHTRPQPTSPVEPGPSQEDCQANIAAEDEIAKQVEANIAALLTSVEDLTEQNKTGAQDVASLKAEIMQLKALQSDRLKAADTNSHYKQAAKWCSEMMGIINMLTGVKLLDFSAETMRLQVVTHAALHLQDQDQQPREDPPQRSISHELVMQLQQGSSQVMDVKLIPATLPILDILEEAEGRQKQLAFLVQEVRWRLQVYWQRQCLIEAAAEQVWMNQAATGEPKWKVSLPNQAELEVLVPWKWPLAGAPLTLTALAVAGSSSEQCQQLMEQVNSNSSLTSRDLAGFIAGVSAEVNRL